MEFVLSKLDACVNSAREVKNNLDRLNATLPRANILLDKAEWWRFKDEHVAGLLMQLRDAAYDAEDVIAEFKYYELQQQIEGKANQLLPSLCTFIKDLIRNSASKVKDIQGRLDFATSELEKAIGVFASSDGPSPHGKAVQHETSSFITDSMLGRDKEVEAVLQIMQEARCADVSNSKNIPSISSSSSQKRRKTKGSLLILPIVGIGGVGKTTFAQHVYNDERVMNHFGLRIWVCVSDHFNLKKVTKEIIESANKECVLKGELENNEAQFGSGTADSITNLESLQQVLIRKVQSRRYLLVLDDVWHENSKDLDCLFSPLKSGLEGSIILVTTRSSKVAELVGTQDPIEIRGLPNDVYWEFFKQCAFGNLNSSSFPELEDIGMRIAVRLDGSPLAAKTLGGILRANMTARQWRNIMNSELWQIEQADGDILPALRVSYQYLPVHLKRCFPVLSLFPKDYPLFLNFLSPVWLADGIITRDNSVSLQDEKFHRYFQEFDNKSFIFTGENNNTYLHDLMHDLAKSVSMYTCHCQDESEWSLQNHNTVRHLSVFRKPIESIDREVGKCKKLRSLLFLDAVNYDTKLYPPSLGYLFNELPYLRVLDLWCCQIEELPEDIGKLKLLFYVNLRGTQIKTLPESICWLYNLQFFLVDGCPIESFPNSFTNLIYLREITDEMDISSMIPGIGKLTMLEKLPEFKVFTEDGHTIKELMNMTRLRDCIKISNLENVVDRKDAAEACLNNKSHLTSLTLSWSVDRNTNTGNVETLIDEGIFEGLEPHPNLEQLKLENYRGRTPASWLRTGKLPCLQFLGITGCSNLQSLRNWLVPHQLLSIRSLEIASCVNLISLPVDWITRSSISSLIIKNCPRLRCSDNLYLPSCLSYLELDSCGEVDKSLPSCLMNVHFLSSLKLQNCNHVTSIPSEITQHLRSLEISNCPQLEIIELSNPSLLEMLSIGKCRKLIQTDSTTNNNAGPAKRIKRLHTLMIDSTSLLKLPFLTTPPESLGTLIIRDCAEERILTGDVQRWLDGPENTVQFILWNCPNLESSPEELRNYGAYIM